MTGPINSKTVVPASLAASVGVGGANSDRSKIGLTGSISTLGTYSSISTLGPPSGGQTLRLGMVTLSFNTTVDGRVSISLLMNAGISTDMFELTLGAGGASIQFGSNERSK